MAIPKVFISSTCFDLGEIREQLKQFVESFGFEAILSEYGDVFYHPDLHTHEACLQEVSHCQLFILIIGGRFGGEYVYDNSKSITNAEYDAAKTSNIPVFTYVKQSVLNSQYFYKENKTKTFASDISYPSIDKQEYALDIFNFINTVQKSNVNNAIEGFDTFQNIETHLRKQWAGMFFDFLKTREVKHQIDATNHLLSGLSSSSNKLEKLIKSLYKSVDKKAEENIELLEIKNNVENFFLNIFALDEDELFSHLIIDMSQINIDKIANFSPKGLKWYEYLIKLGLYEYENENENSIYPVFFEDGANFTYTNINDSVEFSLLKSFEEGVKESDKSIRKEILTNIFDNYKRSK